MLIFALSSLLACGPKTAAAEGPYHGSVPAEALAAPDFQVLNHRGESRTKADLLGHTTVMWFYPMAGTPG